MNEDRIAGAAKSSRARSRTPSARRQRAAKLEADGKAEKVEGKVQNAIGGLKDALKK